MNDWGWVATLSVVVLVLVIVTAAWFSWTATRLDRMHLRCEVAATALRAQLLERSAIAVELAVGGFSDPASALLVLDAARTAREAEAQPDLRQRWLSESDLTQALCYVDLPPEETDLLVSELREAARRATIARRIYNDLAARTLALRARRRVRWFRLVGHAEPPLMIDFDDRVP